jgi:hypothetical protein
MGEEDETKGKKQSRKLLPLWKITPGTYETGLGLPGLMFS